MKEFLSDLKIGGRPMTKNELKINELQQKFDLVTSFINVLKNNLKDYKTKYKKDFLNMLDDILEILGDKNE